MTKHQLIEALGKLNGSPGGAEDWHYEADRLLLEYINDAEIKAAFDDVDKWYA